MKYPVLLLVTLTDDIQVSRLVEMPFPPFPGLRVSDDTFGEVKIAEVLWDDGKGENDEEMFYCPAESLFIDEKLEGVVDWGDWDVVDWPEV